MPPCRLLWQGLVLSRRAEILEFSPFQPADRMTDQFLDFGDMLAVGSRDDRNCSSLFAGAAGAADAMHVILGMDRHVEIEDMADIGNVEAAGGDIRADDEIDLARLERVERGHARALIHVAMQGAGAEPVLQQRFVQDARHRACDCRR